MFTVGHGTFPGNVQRFYVPSANVVGSTAQTLLPNLFDESVDTFFTPKINLRILPNLYADADTFFTPKVSHRLNAGLYTDADTFFTPTVTQPAGSQNLLPSLYTDPDTFFTPVVKGRNTLTPSLYVDTDNFFTQLVKGRNTLTSSLYVNPDIFGSATVSQSGVSQGLSPGDFFGLSFFFDSDVGDGETQGGGRQWSGNFIKPPKYHKLESTDIDSVLREGKDLKIRYTDGKVYNYTGVSDKKVDKLLNAKSPGSFVYKNIKEKHDYRRFT